MHAAYVWNSLRRLGVPSADLEDLTHDVFVQVYRNLGDYDPDQPLRPWLFACALRVASQRERPARRRFERSGEPALADRPGSAPDEDLAASEDRRLVIAALQGIVLERRALFVLYEIDGLPMGAIAGSLGIPLSTAYSRLRVARAEFAAAVKKLRNRPAGAMSDPRPRPLEPELDALLDAERKASPPHEALARVWLRVARSLSPDAGGAASRAAGAKWVASRAAILIASALAVGGAGGAGLHAMVAHPPAVAAAAASPSAERAILDEARAALARNDGARAFALADQHVRRFPRGELGEERESIAIQALVLEGHRQEARTRAARFESASPRSPFLPTIEASLASLR